MKNIILLSVLILFIGSCRDKKPIENPAEDLDKYVEITIDPMYGSQHINSDSLIFETEEGYKLKLREMKIILTDIRNGNNTLSSAAIYDTQKGKTLLKVKGTSANFGNLNFNIGVHSDINHSDPSAFPNDHPLNIVNASDMHWSWNPGYIFFKIEMIADTLNDGVDNFNHIVSYHVGQDTCLRTVSLTNLNWSKVSQYVDQLRLKVDFKKLLNNAGSTIDIKTESVTHSAPETMELSNKLATNFKNALSAWE